MLPTDMEFKFGVSALKSSDADLVEATLSNDNAAELLQCIRNSWPVDEFFRNPKTKEWLKTIVPTDDEIKNEMVITFKSKFIKSSENNIITTNANEAHNFLNEIMRDKLIDDFLRLPKTKSALIDIIQSPT